MNFVIVQCCVQEGHATVQGLRGGRVDLRHQVRLVPGAKGTDVSHTKQALRPQDRNLPKKIGWPSRFVTIRDTHVVICLPGCLSGWIAITHDSSALKLMILSSLFTGHIHVVQSRLYNHF